MAKSLHEVGGVWCVSVCVFQWFRVLDGVNLCFL